MFDAEDRRAISADLGDDEAFDWIGDEDVVAARRAVRGMGRGEQREVVEMGAIGLFLTAPRDIGEGDAGEGRGEDRRRAGTGGPRDAVHRGIDRTYRRAVMMQRDRHAVIIILDHGRDAIRGGRDDKAAAEARQRREIVHQSRASSSAAAIGPPPEVATATLGSPAIWRAPPCPRSWTTAS